MVIYHVVFLHVDDSRPPQKREFMFVSAEALAMNHETKMRCLIVEKDRAFI